jgi:transcriptional regulator with XRE-family HTH domain
MKYARSVRRLLPNGITSITSIVVMNSGFSELLQSDFRERRRKNSSYSLRSYARDLGIHPSLLIRYMRGERSPRIQTLKRLLDRMQADEAVKLMVLNASIQGTAFVIPKDDEYVEVGLEQRERINDWIYSSMLELFRSKNRKFKLLDLSRFYGIPIREVEARIRVLMEVGLLVKTQSGFRTKTTRQSSRGLGNLVSVIHQGYFEQAIRSIHEDRLRDISGTTIWISRQRLEEAKKRIRDFRRSLSAFLAVRPEEKEEALFRIQIALFSLEPK